MSLQSGYNPSLTIRQNSTPTGRGTYAGGDPVVLRTGNPGSPRAEAAQRRARAGHAARTATGRTIRSTTIRCSRPRSRLVSKRPWTARSAPVATKTPSASGEDTGRAASGGRGTTSLEPVPGLRLGRLTGSESRVSSPRRRVAVAPHGLFESSVDEALRSPHARRGRRVLLRPGRRGRGGKATCDRSAAFLRQRSREQRRGGSPAEASAGRPRRRPISERSPSLRPTTRR